MNRIGLYAVDSKLRKRRGKRQGDAVNPNLALMKLSRYYKKRGDKVEIYKEGEEYDVVYVSKIFTWSKLPEEIPNNWVIGGSGHQHMIVSLPEHVEHLMPDYGMFGAKKFYGFTTRGCPRKCKFCVVSEKEGDFRIVTEEKGIGEFCGTEGKRYKFEDIVLYDNNILADSEHFFRIAKQINERHLRVDFNQGLDHRFLDNDICKVLSGMKHYQYRFSFDFLRMEKSVLRAISMLRKHGLKQNFWYLLTGYNTTIEQDLERIHLLRKEGQLVYVQRYNKNPNKFLVPLAMWANQPWIFKSYSWRRFMEHESKVIYNKLYKDNGLKGLITKYGYDKNEAVNKS